MSNGSPYGRAGGRWVTAANICALVETDPAYDESARPNYPRRLVAAKIFES